MSNAIWFITFKLVEGASVADFLAASEKVHNEVISKQKGYISWKVLVDGDTWADLVTWETIEDAKNAETAGESNPLSHEFFSFMNESSINSRMFSVERNY